MYAYRHLIYNTAVSRTLIKCEYATSMKNNKTRKRESVVYRISISLGLRNHLGQLRLSVGVDD